MAKHYSAIVADDEDDGPQQQQQQQQQRQQQQQEDPELPQFREQLRRQRGGGSTTGTQLALLGVLKQRRSIVRICQIVFEVIAFSLASVVPELPPGEFHWFDFAVIVCVIAFVLDLIFIATYVVDSDGWDGCVKSVQVYVPNVEVLITVIWNIFMFSASVALAVNISSLIGIVPSKDLRLVRTSMSFAFFATFGWTVSTGMLLRSWYDTYRGSVHSKTTASSDSP